MSERHATLLTYLEPSGKENKVIIQTEAPISRMEAETFLNRLAAKGRPYERLLDIRDVSNEYR